MGRPQRAVGWASLIAALAIAVVLALPGPRSARAEAFLPSTGPEVPASTLRDDLTKLFDAVVAITEKNFYNEGRLKQTDWSARARAVRDGVIASPTAADAVRQINELLADLKTSHTALYTPDDYAYYMLLDVVGFGGDPTGLRARQFWGDTLHYPGTGAFTDEVEGRHFIDGILEGSPADQAGLKFGDEIVSVDGRPYSPIAAFRGKSGISVQFEVRRAAGVAPELVKVQVLPIRPAAAFTAATAASARVIERNGRRIGYVHIWASHDDTGLRTALASISPDRDRHSRSGDQPAPLDALIIDMRGRIGGRLNVAGEFLDRLDRPSKPYWGSQRIFGRSGTSERSDGAGRFRGRSALLIDHHSRSAAEIMALGFKRSQFGRLFGTQTAGAVSSGGTFVLPGDFVLYLAVSGLEFDGQPLEGVGVAPDTFVARPLAYAGGADPVLDAAVEHLAQSVEK